MKPRIPKNQPSANFFLTTDSSSFQFLFVKSLTDEITSVSHCQSVRFLIWLFSHAINPLLFLLFQFPQNQMNHCRPDFVDCAGN
jgi:hypothetical protein